MDSKELEKRIERRTFRYSSRSYGWGPRAPDITEFCKEFKISRTLYYRLRRKAIRKREAEHREADRQDKHMIYTITLWAGGYRNMTPLEFRLAYAIPASTFYSYSLWGGGKSPRVNVNVPEEPRGPIYPCDCLKREGAGQYLRSYHKLHGALMGWYVLTKCKSCQGTGVVCLTHPPYGCPLGWREAARLLELEKKERVA